MKAVTATLPMPLQVPSHPAEKGNLPLQRNYTLVTLGLCSGRQGQGTISKWILNTEHLLFHLQKAEDPQ